VQAKAGSACCVPDQVIRERLGVGNKNVGIRGTALGQITTGPLRHAADLNIRAMDKIRLENAETLNRLVQGTIDCFIGNTPKLPEPTERSRPACDEDQSNANCW